MQLDLFDAAAVLVLTTGDVSDEELQSRLRELGYYDGPRESTPWRGTLIALKRFQHDHGLPETGLPDQQTMMVLRESYCY